MTTYLIVAAIAAIFGVAIGFVIGVNEVSKRAADGVCIQAEDGEAYLKISESGQKKLMEPSTKLLYIRVIRLKGFQVRPYAK